MKFSEPAIVHNTHSLQGLKNRLIASINATTDENKLQECLELLHEDTMPCCFTDEEFGEEIRRSEVSGNASEEDVKSFFAKWGH